MRTATINTSATTSGAATINHPIILSPFLLPSSCHQSARSASCLPASLRSGCALPSLFPPWPCHSSNIPRVPTTHNTPSCVLLTAAACVPARHPVHVAVWTLRRHAPRLRRSRWLLGLRDHDTRTHGQALSSAGWSSLYSIRKINGWFSSLSIHCSTRYFPSPVDPCAISFHAVFPSQHRHIDSALIICTRFSFVPLPRPTFT